MNRTFKFHWLAVISLFLPLLSLIGIIFLSWLYLAPAEKQLLAGVSQIRFIFFFSAAGLLMIGLGFTLVWIMKHHIIPATRLAEETELIRSGNLSHRIQPAGSVASGDRQRWDRELSEAVDELRGLDGRWVIRTESG